jgi:hypothetical protein
VFENSKIPLSAWMAATFVLTAYKKGISSHQLARDFGITQKTAWFVLHRLHYITEEEAPEPDLKEVVEIDETYIGGNLGNMHKIDVKFIRMLMQIIKSPLWTYLKKSKARLTVIGAKSLKML